MTEKRCRRCSELHRKLQKAEGELIRLRKKLEDKPVNTWASPERQSEAVDRDRDAATIDRANAAKILTRYSETFEILGES